MNNNSKLIAFFAIVVVVLVGCKKEEGTIPTLTEESVNVANTAPVVTDIQNTEPTENLQQNDFQATSAGNSAIDSSTPKAEAVNTDQQNVSHDAQESNFLSQGKTPENSSIIDQTQANSDTNGVLTDNGEDD